MELNQRLTDNMYLDVIRIMIFNEQITFEEGKGEILDYALRMNRMDNSKQMNLLLKKGEVQPLHMEQLAEKLATFHAYTDVIERPLNVKLLWQDFADLLKVKDFITESLGPSFGTKIEESVRVARDFLDQYEHRLLERHQMGYTIDGHGDLHSKNIFLLDQPVIFDCIEFNDHLRQVDVLNELAFFCLDLDFYGRKDLESIFLDQYFIKYPCLFNEADHLIFQYYKLYRANVKLKVNALKAMQELDDKEKQKYLTLVEDYFILMNRYLSAFSYN